jgi:hypothetical protein
MELRHASQLGRSDARDGPHVVIDQRATERAQFPRAAPRDHVAPALRLDVLAERSNLRVELPPCAGAGHRAEYVGVRVDECLHAAQRLECVALPCFHSGLRVDEMMLSTYKTPPNAQSRHLLLKVGAVHMAAAWCRVRGRVRGGGSALRARTPGGVASTGCGQDERDESVALRVTWAAVQVVRPVVQVMSQSFKVGWRMVRGIRRAVRGSRVVPTDLLARCVCQFAGRAVCSAFGGGGSRRRPGVRRLLQMGAHCMHGMRLR